MTRSASLSGGVDVDVVFRLGDANAPRRCGSCDSDARYYVYDDAAEVSRYVCPEHLDAAVRDAGGDPDAVTLDDGHARRNGRPRGGGE
jgi:hypothetical protein